MKGVPCDGSHMITLYENPLLNGGCVEERYSVGGLPVCGVLDGQPYNRNTGRYEWSQVWPDPLQHICQRAYALEALQFTIFGVSTILIFLDFLMLKRKGETFSFKPWKRW